MATPRWTLHLPTMLTSRDEAIILATALRDALAHITAIDFGETTLSEEDRQFLRIRVWCDARLDGVDRCRRRDDHAGPCGTAEPAGGAGPAGGVHTAGGAYAAGNTDPGGGTDTVNLSLTNRTLDSNIIDNVHGSHASGSPPGGRT